MGAALLIFGVFMTIDRVRFFSGSVTMQVRVLRQQAGDVEVLPEGGRSTIFVERPIIGRVGRARKSYKVGSTVEIRADTAVVPIKAYMNSLYSLWFFPVGSIFGGLFLLLLGYATLRPWKLEPASDER